MPPEPMPPPESGGLRPAGTVGWKLGALLVFALYVITGRLGILLALPPGLATPIWIPSGIAMVGVCLWGARIWPAVWLGSLGVNALTLFDLSSVSRVALTSAVLAAVATGSTLQALLAAALLKRITHGSTVFLDTVTGVFKFALVSTGSGLLGATIGAFALVGSGLAPRELLGPTWVTWWLGDVAGVLIVATLWFARHGVPSPRWGEAALLGALIAAGWVLLYTMDLGRAYLFIPLVVWSSVRHGAWGVGWSIFLLILLAVFVTLSGRGPFVQPTSYESLLLLQGFFGILLLTGLSIAAAFAERRRAEQGVREAEARSRAMLESSLDAFVSMDHRGRIIEWNPAAERMFGYPRGFAVGREMAELIVPPALRDRHREGLRRYLATGEKSVLGRQIEMPALRADGSEFPAELAITRVAAPGEPIFTGFIRDITERKTAEQALRAWNQALEEEVAARTAEARRRAELLQALTVELSDAEERERRRVAQILHDQVQQLLVAARMRIQLLTRRVRGTDLIEPVAAADDLIDQAIQESRTLTSELSPPVLLDAGLDVALEWLVTWMREKHGLIVSLEVRGEVAHLPENLAALLFRAVRELLFNVRKHAGVDRAAVIVERNGWTVRVTVEDQGVGLDAAAPRPAQKTPGHFGLFSLQERLAYIGGKISIESGPGRGTRVMLVAPIEDATRRDVPERADQELELPSPASKAIRVVLADDHRMVREGMAELLQRFPDIEVVGQAADGKSAVDLAGSLKPDVVVMDVTMPRMNGIEATRLIRASQPATQIVGVSVHAEGDLAMSMRRAGAAAYLEKDAASELLVDAIRTAARSRV